MIALQERRATLVSLVPTALLRLGDDAARFRTILLGGSAIPPDRPGNCVATYGMTETASGVVYDGLPLDGVEVRVDDDGEISLRTPRHSCVAIAHGTDLKGAQGWFATGDAGALSAERGCSACEGRIGEVISRSRRRKGLARAGRSTTARPQGRSRRGDRRCA